MDVVSDYSDLIHFWWQLLIDRFKLLYSLAVTFDSEYLIFQLSRTVELYSQTVIFLFFFIVNAQKETRIRDWPISKNSYIRKMLAEFLHYLIRKVHEAENKINV